MKEITITFRDGSNVGLGVLDETGRKFHHIRFIKNAGQGGTELAEKAVEIPIGEVDIIDGYDYEALIGFQDRNRAMLEWRGLRQRHKQSVTVEIVAAEQKKVESAMRKWDRENPMPVGITGVLDQTGTTDSELIVHPAVVHEVINRIENPAGVTACGVCEMQEPYHAVDCSLAPPDDDEDTDESPPDDEQEPLIDFQRPTAPTEEEAQETPASLREAIRKVEEAEETQDGRVGVAPVDQGDVDVPF